MKGEIDEEAKDVGSRAWDVALLALGMFWVALSPAQAAEEYYKFRSVLSTPGANWCIGVPEYQAGGHLLIAACSPDRPHQIFGYESGGTITGGGYCVDAQSANPNQPAAAGAPVILAECTDADRQSWELQPFQDRPNVFAIANADGLCVTVGGQIGQGAALVLAQCEENDHQGWLRSTPPAPAGGGAGGEEIYWYSGHRYCWYDGGWHGAGWYWCGENSHQGIGWGGPIGFHHWHHHGHPAHPHPHFVPHHHGRPHAVPHHYGRPHAVQHQQHKHFAPHKRLTRQQHRVQTLKRRVHRPQRKVKRKKH